MPKSGHFRAISGWNEKAGLPMIFRLLNHPSSKEKAGFRGLEHGHPGVQMKTSNHQFGFDGSGGNADFIA
jgi:hypothetical protein